MHADMTLGEFDIIARYFEPLARAHAGGLGLSDDAAVLDVPPGRSLVVSTDTIVAGTHFLLAEDRRLAGGKGASATGDEAAVAEAAIAEEGADVAAKGFAVGFSDLAAMGADAFGYTLALALPRGWGGARLERWLDGFSAELAAWQRTSGATLLGGDTVATPGPLSLTLTVFGTVAAGQALRRAGAAVGDDVYVSGTIGDAALGLEVIRGELGQLTGEHRSALALRYRRPQPRLALGARLVGVASAAADISDGLVADLGHICRASGVDAIIEAARIPLSPAGKDAVARDPGRLKTVLEGGDDYELVFTAPPEAGTALARIAADAGVPLTAIGRIRVAQLDTGRRPAPVRVIGEDGKQIPISTGGYSHF